MKKFAIIVVNGGEYFGTYDGETEHEAKLAYLKEYLPTHASEDDFEREYDEVDAVERVSLREVVSEALDSEKVENGTLKYTAYDLDGLIPGDSLEVEFKAGAPVSAKIIDQLGNIVEAC